MIRACVIAAVVGLMPSAALAGDQGVLVIAGGAVEPDNTAIWGKFIDALPHPESDRIAVIVSASGEPILSFESARKTLEKHGIARERVILIKAAVIDDPSTSEDERDWQKGGFDADNLRIIATAGGVWLTGGDQVRTARIFYTSEGQATPLLAALHERLKQGAVIGGSSAGAAIQSGTMIASGDSFTALTTPVGNAADQSSMNDGALVLGRGANFFPFGVIDQHFDRQARLGRLARAVTLTDGPKHGFGIDENTALIVDLKTARATVAGPGTVTLLDASGAKKGSGPGFHVTDLGLGLISAGDEVDLKTLQVRHAAFKTTDALKKPYYDHVHASGGGIALPNQKLEDMLTLDLVDNAKAGRLDRWTFGDNGTAVRYRFEERPITQAFGGKDAAGKYRYSISALAFSIVQAAVTFRTLEPE
ncbi:cyanophycinase [Asticcacaulis sp. AC402]|uniref:cyanophycinase n=1 Tax=Asticcacaulis sp. AC402 TaxID=1282361 RepID=UPI0003C3BD1B|nr:cyanophycinase [Asticcacaulis sp. AC402]ESQ74266.1 hypothetical protein ABAC402_14970 [Asticcacaulis sp. AC402]